MKNISKFLVIILFILIPLNALLTTFLKCKLNINTDIIRFWKEIIIIILFFVIFYRVVIKRYKFNFSKLYKNNYILGTITAFIFVSLAFIFLPYGKAKISSFLGFKYDVFFLIAFVIGLYLTEIKNNFEKILNYSFIIIGIILIIFLPWYLFGDISLLSSIFGYSSNVSTYNANQCIAFSQNVNGHHRFQATLSGPIRWSVFLTSFYFIFLGFILQYKENNLKLKTKKSLINLFIIFSSIFVISSIFFSYSKTTILGLFFGFFIFLYFILKIKYKKNIGKKFIFSSLFLTIISIISILVLKKDLFLHLGSVINRFDNLKTSISMFLWNPFGYGLGIAGPASWVGHSMESAGGWEVAVLSTEYTHKFLPENWFIQILLEQGIIGLALFSSIIIIIILKLYKIVIIRKDFISIGIFTAFVSLIFMANFTHAFEESATSYSIFMIVGAWIAKNNLIKRK